MGFAKSFAMLNQQPLHDRLRFEPVAEPQDACNWCNCAEFRASGVCNHVLRAAQLRLLRRMIAIESGKSGEA